MFQGAWHPRPANSSIPAYAQTPVDVRPTLRWRKADSNLWSPLHRRRLRDRPWSLVRMRVPAGETNSFTGGTDGSNPLSSRGESANHRFPCYRLHHVTAPVVPVLMRIRRVWGLAPLRARSQRQHNDECGEPFVPVHCFLRATRSAVPNPHQRYPRSGSGHCS